MKELWNYWSPRFEEQSRDIKNLLKTKKYKDYEDIVYGKLLL